MANELLVGVKIGAALSGSFHAAFGSAKSTLDRIGQVADKLGNKHQQLGTAMAAAMAKPISNIGALRGQYDRLGQTMDQLRRKQDQLTASIARGDQLKNQRKELRSDAMETVGTALAIGAPVAKSVQVAAAFTSVAALFMFWVVCLTASDIWCAALCMFSFTLRLKSSAVFDALLAALCMASCMLDAFWL